LRFKKPEVVRTFSEMPYDLNIEEVAYFFRVFIKVMKP
jgi:hypothetical protein